MRLLHICKNVFIIAISVHLISQLSSVPGKVSLFLSWLLLQVTSYNHIMFHSFLKFILMLVLNVKMYIVLIKKICLLFTNAQML